MTTKHAPTPYALAGQYLTYQLDGNACLMAVIQFLSDQPAQNEVDAAFLLRACNTHDEAREALGEAWAAMSSAPRFLSPAGMPEVAKHRQSVLARCESILAKMEGGA